MVTTDMEQNEFRFPARVWVAAITTAVVTMLVVVLIAIWFIQESWWNAFFDLLLVLTMILIIGASTFGVRMVEMTVGEKWMKVAVNKFNEMINLIKVDKPEFLKSNISDFDEIDDLFNSDN